jgi:hypothetical protein
MTGIKLRKLRNSLSDREFEVLCKKWLTVADRLLDRYQKQGGSVTAKEVINETYVNIASDARGHECPDEISIEAFFARKIETTIHRLLKRQKRSAKRNVEIVPAIENALSVPAQPESQELRDLIHDGVVVLNTALDESNAGKSLRSYVKSMELIITAGLNAEEAAKLVSVHNPKSLATYRNRLLMYVNMNETLVDKNKKK